MNKLRLAGAVGALLMTSAVLAGCSGTGKDNNSSGGGDSHDFKYAVITHAAPGDAFWDRVKSGAEKAGNGLRRHRRLQTPTPTPPSSRS